MRTSKGALREGVIYDLMGRLTHEDVRERTINAICQRYSVDSDTATIVNRRAKILFKATRKAWSLKAQDWDLVHWAALSHEIGMAISHKHYNRHSAYLLRNSDLPGFSQQEQEQLAVLAAAHRGKLSDELFVDVADEDRGRVSHLITIMRLAAVFKYVEQLEELPDFTITAGKGRICLDLPEGWLENHPLTAWELSQQVNQLAKIGIGLEYE